MKHGSVFLILLTLSLISCSSGPQQQQQANATASPELTGTYVFYRKAGDGTAPQKNPVAADVKVVEGTIKGLIVQKSAVKQGPSEKDPTKTVYSGSYSLINGSEVGAIDEEGVHKQGTTIVLISVTQEGTTFDDTEVLQLAMDMPEGAFFGTRTKEGGTIFRIGGSGKPTTSPDTLLGEFRIDPATRKGRLIHAVEVTSDTELVTIPVKNFIAFKPQADTEAKKP
jgi:hypothetical protein